MDGKTNAGVSNVFTGFRWVQIPGFFMDGRASSKYTPPSKTAYYPPSGTYQYFLSNWSDAQRYYYRNSGVCRAGYSYTSITTYYYYSRSLTYDSIKDSIEYGMKQSFTSNLLYGNWEGVKKIKVYARYADFMSQRSIGCFIGSRKVDVDSQPSTYFIYNLDTKKVESHNFQTSFTIYSNENSLYDVYPAFALYDIEIIG